MSDVTFSCPHCNKQLSGSEDMEGATISCPSCQTLLTIPIRIVIPEDPPPPQSDGGHGDLTCPYCRMPLCDTDAIKTCASCRTPHHAECWTENKGCTVFGCAESPEEEEKISVAPQSQTDSTAQRAGYGRTPTAAGQTAPASQQNVPTYLAQSILVTIFCCMPFGIVAIVYSAQVNSKLKAGDYAGAVECSNKAKTWGWVSFGIGLAIGLIKIFAVVADS